jgi:ParB family chromosome partitioning protein
MILIFSGRDDKMVLLCKVSFFFERQALNMSADVKQLRFDALVDFSNHPFKPYSGARLADMVDSVRENGVIIPIIVRPRDENTYEILSGHNRVNAAKLAGLTEIPAVVRDGLTDDDALSIVMITNMMQRSLSEMLPSEKALCLETYMSAERSRGKRNDLIKEIGKLTTATTLAPMVPKLDSGLSGKRLTARDKAGAIYGLDRMSVTRYLRINKLIKPLRDRLDANFLDGDPTSVDISFRAAVSLSYLRDSEQEIVEDALRKLTDKVGMREAEQLRQLSADHKLTKAEIDAVLFRGNNTEKRRRFRVDEDVLSEYGLADMARETIEEIIKQALDMWYTSDKSYGHKKRDE